MYLHIGKDFIINSNSIIAIFNIDYVKNTKEYKTLYKSLEEENSLINVNNDKKSKAFILIEEDKKQKAYITNVGVNTILKRMI